MSYKPIFNTEMVKAILDGQKTQMRWCVKPQPTICTEEELKDRALSGFDPYGFTIGITTPEKSAKECPCQPGDILWVKEPWLQRKCDDCQDCDCGPDIIRKWKVIPCYDGIYLYNATDFISRPIKWRPCIHIPREAARIFLRVTGVRAERLNDMCEEDAMAEGFADSPAGTDSPLKRYSAYWDRHIKCVDLREYGWDANPWVWAIEFERCEEPEGWCE